MNFQAKGMRLFLIISFMMEELGDSDDIVYAIGQRKLICTHLVGQLASSDNVGLAVASCPELSEETRAEIFRSEQNSGGIGWYFVHAKASPLAQGILGQLVHVVGLNLLPNTDIKQCEAFVCPLSQFESEEAIPVKVLIGDLTGECPV